MNDAAVAKRLDHTVKSYSDQMLAAYREHPPLIDEHAGLEENIAQGGYGRRQVLELIQNGADELIGSPGGRIHVVLTEDHLYCANEGSAISAEGIAAILLANVSPKRGDEIGRFGLGFKSVLGVTERPEFFSQAVSFGFDREWAAGRIEEAGGAREAYPILRIARLLDLGEESAGDEVLSELMSWATTVVRLPLAGRAEWLAADLREFDAAFLLFSPHVGALTLEDSTSGLKRSIRMSRSEDDLVLQEDEQSQRWRVFQTECAPSEEARRDSGKLQHRKNLPIAWAVPVDGRLEVGQFWAFFPLRDQTTLSGIANAPWQINDDRTGLLEGSRLNEELLEALVELALTSLSSLVPEDDPGRVLDLMPARGREARCWGDDVLTQSFNIQRIRRACVPDQDGVLRRIEHLRVPPFGVPAVAQEAWAGHRRRPTDWVHPSAATSPTRRNRIQNMLESMARVAESPAGWLEVLLEEADADHQDCAEAVKVAAVAARSTDLTPGTLEGLRDAEIVLNDADEWSRLDPSWIWIDEGDGTREPAVVVVHAEVMAQEGIRVALDDLGILPVTPELEFNALFPEAETADADAWEELWTIAREIGDVEDAAQLLRENRREHGPYSVRVAAGHWQPCTSALLPGRVLEVGASFGQSVVVDDQFHAPDLDLLRRAGMSDGPFDGGTVEDDPLAQEWSRHSLDLYAKSLANTGSRPARAKLEIDRADVPLPLAVLPLIHGEACARFVAELVRIPGVADPRYTRHATVDRYPVQSCDSPAVWAIKKWGVLATSLSDVRATSECVGPALYSHRAILPVVDVPDAVAEQLDLPQQLTDIPVAMWQELLGATVDCEPEDLGSLLAIAIEAGIDPIGHVKRGDGSELDLRQVVAATEHDDISSIRGLGLNVAVVGSPILAEQLCSDWHMRSASEFFSKELIAIEEDEPTAALDLFPDLAALDPRLRELQIVVCEELVIEQSSEEGTVSTSIDHQLEGSILYVAGDTTDDSVILDALLEVKGWELSPEEREHALESRRSAEGRALARSVAKADALDEKLLLAIGRDALQRRLPKQVVEEMSTRWGTLSDEKMVQLALAVHGVELLRLHREDMRANGLDVPSTWAAGSSARRFVLELGFPEQYAGFKTASRDALVHVPGPPQMPDLHEFQREAADRIRDLVRGGKGRGMLSLPTGAGKTRTAVQAIIESMRDGELRGPVLWVAQTDELCEQAVSSWSDNWRAVGPRETLKLARLWSGNEAQDLHDPHQVVVATIAKLEVVMDKPEYEWLSMATTVIVDEAHRAISPAYTRLLNWLGMGRGKERIPFIGLSATPFRGTSEVQTKALVNRFNDHRLDTMGEDPYGTLQDMEVLSRVEHRLLSGSKLKLKGSELKELQQTRRLPASALERIGEDKSRNQTILDSIIGLDGDHTVLLFAASVPHAEMMAGLLSAEGIPSRAISARTDKGARHYYIEQFREGEIRVLTNYGVLTEGFDAPAVRAVYVARPTYSPNVYQQMIGRGLRGPRNGGKEMCLIVNIADNLAAYGESLAFTEFEHLWDGS